MSKLQLSMTDMLNHFDPDFGLIIDLFAGGGGASEGIRAALGRDPDVAVNHDPEAISMHTMNHHDTMHFTADVFEVDPKTIFPEYPVGLLWASPACTHFSKARGSKPVCKQLRSPARLRCEWLETAFALPLQKRSFERIRTRHAKRYRYLRKRRKF